MMNSYWHTDVIIIGAGLAGLTTAWHLRDRCVTIVRPPDYGAASYLARGGIAAAIGEHDRLEDHVQDTINAGDGLVDPDVADLLVSDGIERMIDLFELSIDFDRDEEGRLQLGREALHSHCRIVHAAGDETGRHVTSAVRDELRARRDVTFVDGRALECIERDGRVAGVVFDAGLSTPQVLLAPATVLATGGMGGLYERSTNPVSARGEGLAIAARAGATLADLEFVQFHPTALDCNQRPLPLLSEAIRGQGATLIDGDGQPVMDGHPKGDLAGRDVVSRALWNRIVDGIDVYLDATCIDDFSQQFPAAFDACQKAGLDPASDRIPITPAAHYHMGGVATDNRAATSLPGLWAVGEVASTGAHGANRLASNSLLEALVFGARAARDIGAVPRNLHSIPLDRVMHLRNSWRHGLRMAEDASPIHETLARLMWTHVGIKRSNSSLVEALNHLNNLIADLERHNPARLAVEAARSITRAAWRRTESRGAHYRVDFPKPDDLFQNRLFVRDSKQISSSHSNPRLPESEAEPQSSTTPPRP